jgi:glycerophosphoryl diester phosphodiesterase
MCPRLKNLFAGVVTRCPEYAPDGHLTENGVPVVIHDEAYVSSVHVSADAVTVSRQNANVNAIRMSIVLTCSRKFNQVDCSTVAPGFRRTQIQRIPDPAKPRARRLRQQPGEVLS